MPTTQTPRTARTTVSGGLGYYPFGMMQEGRQFVGGMGYRWGFGSQEADNEVSGRGNSYTAEFWQYDSRLGRRWNVDPVFKHYTSNYSVLGNNPLMLIDHNGADTSFLRSDNKTWDKEASDNFNTAYSDICNRVNNVQIEINGLSEELKNESLSSRKKKNKEDNISRLNDKLTKLKLIKDDFDYILLKTSPLVTYSTDIKELEAHKDGTCKLQYNTMADADGNFINTLQSAKVIIRPGRISTFVHENRHVLQPHGMSPCDSEIEAYTYQRIFSYEDVEKKIQSAYENEYKINPNTTLSTRPTNYGIKEMVQYRYNCK
jgi:hypothetical protein